MTNHFNKINILPHHIKCHIKDYLWGSSSDWKNIFKSIIDGACVSEISHIDTFNEPYTNHINNVYNTGTLFRLNNIVDRGILILLKSIPLQRRSSLEYGIEDENYCYVCGEKAVFPFTRFICYDCEVNNKLSTCQACGLPRIRLFCYDCSENVDFHY